MSIAVPAAAVEAGMERLVFSDDFESQSTVDLANEQTEGFCWYVDRAYGRPPMQPDELEWHTDESFVRILSKMPTGILSRSSNGKIGFAFKEGYVEARIRLTKRETTPEKHPYFFLLGQTDIEGRSWVDNGIITVMSAPCTKDKNGERRPYYCGSLHHYQRSWKRDKKGNPITRSASNLVNATGYRDWFTFLDEEWHTYGLLWEKGHIAWYMDGREMHSVRFAPNELPRHYYRNNPRPLPPIEEKHPEFAKSQWFGAYTVFDEEPMVLSLCSREEWPMDVDWVRVWQK